MTGFVHFDNYQEVVCRLSGRTIRLNLDPERFLIIPEPEWDLTCLNVGLRPLSERHKVAITSKASALFRSIVKPLLADPTQSNLIVALSRIMEGRGPRAGPLPSPGIRKIRRGSQNS